MGVMGGNKPQNPTQILLSPTLHKQTQVVFLVTCRCKCVFRSKTFTTFGLVKKVHMINKYL